ncbi:MAG: hypothetical protein IPH88_16980 [Bacteroidales bacterium]|nr:hypothetical protein [Bacteroidales bacterium]
MPSINISIHGESSVCQTNYDKIYTADFIEGVTYDWTLPDGVTGSSNSNVITVHFGQSSVSGNISVRAFNSCGDSLTALLPLTINPLPDMYIWGNPDTTYTCNGSWNVYCASGADQYTWSTGDNWECCGFYSQGSTNVTLLGTNNSGCSSTKTIHVISSSSIPSAAGTIEGPENVCIGQDSITYSVSPINDATSYTWSLPSGVTGTSNSSSITVNITPDAQSADISVQGENGCGSGQMSVLLMTVAASLPQTGQIICLQEGLQYAINPLEFVENYTWTVPDGWTITEGQGTNSISVISGTFGGIIQVTPSFSCGNGSTSSLKVGGATISINGTSAICSGNLNETFSTDLIDGAVYNWIVQKAQQDTAIQIPSMSLSTHQQKAELFKLL